MIHRTRIRKIGWAVVLLTCTALYMGLHFRVNAVKSEVRLAERQIIALQEERLLLETEFQTRSNQRQLANWNEVEFGYHAPTASQFIEGERQLAQFGVPRGRGAPEPIRVVSASALSEDPMSFAAMVSPLSGRAMAAQMPEDGSPGQAAGEDLSTRLMRGAARIALDEITEGAE